MPGLGIGKADSRLALAQEGDRRSGSKSDTHIGRDLHLILITIMPLFVQSKQVETTAPWESGTYKKDGLGLQSTAPWA